MDDLGQVQANHHDSHGDGEVAKGKRRMTYQRLEEFTAQTKFICTRQYFHGLFAMRKFGQEIAIVIIVMAMAN